MAFCDNCGNFDKSYADSIELTEDQIKNTPFMPYEPKLNYFLAYQMDSLKGLLFYECLCEICLKINKSEGKKYEVVQPFGDKY